MYKHDRTTVPSSEGPVHKKALGIAIQVAFLAKGVERLLNFLMVLALISMITLVFTNVVLRYGFNSGISVSVELSRFLFVWITFLGAVTALLRHEHLRVTTLSERFPVLVQAVLNRLVTLVMLGCCLMLLNGSYYQTLLNWDNISPISGIPVGVFYLAGLIAGLLMSIILFYRLIMPSTFQGTHKLDKEKDI
ncbi:MULTISPECIES: TRAP transporter small permease [Halomonas]|uniref:TRAP transporter small permease n=1 Tax=Halomonas TaxID=2745 RepID=UPI001C3C2D2A|nr:TRAP transporter small permease [Halomonas citrativorans]